MNNWLNIKVNMLITKLDMLSKRVKELRNIAVVTLLILAFCLLTIRALQIRIVKLENRMQVIEEQSKNEVRI